MDYIYGRTDKPQGINYTFNPKTITDNTEMQRFVEMCFDPRSSINERLKQTLLQLLEDKYVKRRYSLDNQQLCFLSVFLSEQNELESISFDVETAEDYHYQIYANQLPKLCEYLQCTNNEKDIAAAFTAQLKTWKNPIEIADMCRQADIVFQVHHWY